MFRKNNNTPHAMMKSSGNKSGNKKETIPSIVTQDVNVLGNIVSDSNIDFDGTLNGNIRCSILTIRENGFIKGEVVANNVFIYGKVKGLVRAKHVHLFAGCNVEGIVMHETLSIEDGAFIDGKCKRTDKIQTAEDEADSDSDTDFVFDDSNTVESKILENIRLIR